MKISFYQQATNETEQQHSGKTHMNHGSGKAQQVSAAYAAVARGGDMHLDGMAGKGADKGKSLIELQQEAGAVDVGVQRDYMTLMSHTMSEEDYAKMQEEGFDFSGMDPEEVVTIVDRIKAELVRAGKDIKGYTDDLDMDTLAAALGSDALAKAVADSFSRADIPLTEENLAAVEQAWNMGNKLQPMDDGSRQYLIDNEMEPEIWNLYLAENSGAGQGGSVPRFYEEDVKGYYAQQYTGQLNNAVEADAQRQRSQSTRKADAKRQDQPQGAQKTEAQKGIQSQGAQKNSVQGEAQTKETERDQGLQKQIDRVIERSGREVDQESREMAEWLMDRGLPLTEENLDRLESLRQVELPLTEEAFAQASANAMAVGKDPMYASLAGSEKNLYERAAEISEYYHSSEAWEKAVGDITARRQLEEIRLRMTAEVNVKLLKSGFSIDTAPMEQLIQALRHAEQQLAAHYFPGDAHAVDKYRTYQNVNAVVSEIPGLPADVLGGFVTGAAGDGISDAFGDYASDITPEMLHSTGKAMQESYEKAQTRYEELMTSPREDLGDSIQKAFGNVDDILDYLGLEFTEENRRAVRILGYNNMEMTHSNLRTVLEADRKVKAVVEKLTPAATLKMIRDGVNPLEKSFDELEQYFDELPREYKDEAQSYSRFLYGLEKNNKITAEEREGYIGIYRLVHQIEKSDGAAVGALVNTHAELRFANLLSAVRTSRVKSMDIRADINAAAEMMRDGASISAQIAKAFSTGARKLMSEVSYSKEAEQEYNAQELETMRQSVTSAEKECIAMLQRGEMSQSADNLMAAQALLHGSENIFARSLRQGNNNGIKDYDNGGEDYELDGGDLWEMLDDKEEFAQEYASTAKAAEEAVEEMTFEAESSVDVRRMQLLHKQLHVASSLARQEEYFLPMYLGDTVARVHLTMNRTGGNQGNVVVDVKFEDERIHADLQLEQGTINGILTTENPNEVMKLRKIADNFRSIAGSRWKVGDVSVASAGAARQETEAAGERTESSELYRVAKVFLQSVQQGGVSRRVVSRL